MEHLSPYRSDLADAKRNVKGTAGDYHERKKRKGLSRLKGAEGYSQKWDSADSAVLMLCAGFATHKNLSLD